MDPNRLKKLYQKKVNGSLTKEERFELWSLINDTSNDKEIKRLLDDTWFEMQEADFTDIPDTEVEKIYTNIVSSPQKKRKIGYRLYARVGVAAMLILSIGIGFYFYISSKSNQEILIAGQQKKQVPIEKQPVSDKITLTLADGEEIILDDVANGQLALQSDISINKINGNELVYTAKENPNMPLTPQWNTISIPRGAEYKVVLPDGTSVYLNSESSLSYPVSFRGAERNVKLIGEAYFDVAKNVSMPFKVDVYEGKQIVEVLGTQFNIAAYKDEKRIITTLVEGSVKVGKAKNEVLLKPGQFAMTTVDNEKIMVANADINEVTAWKNGYFIFNNENIKSIMSKISRWYNINVEYQGTQLEDKNILGIYQRSTSLENLLKDIESAEGIRFKIDGNKVIVIGKK